MKKSDLEITFKQQLRDLIIDGFQEEFYFAKPRRFRFDFANPELKIAIELEGGTWSKGKSRHTTGKGFRDDCRKYNIAGSLGWTVYRGDATMVRRGELVNFLKKVLNDGRN